jgi:hypothetical protein
MACAEPAVGGCDQDVETCPGGSIVIVDELDR